jgi:hypothetical protein
LDFFSFAKPGDNEMATLHGKCYCGAIEFELPRTSDTQILHCHCKGCREWTGAAFFSAIMVDSVRVTKGVPKQFQREGGPVKHFCVDCGTGLYNGIFGGTKFTAAAGLVAENAELESSAHCQMVRKVPWCNTSADGKPAYEEWPTVDSKQPSL